MLILPNFTLHKSISQALRNQTELVNTPGLFDSGERGRGLKTAEDYDVEMSFYGNGIVPY